MHQERVYRKKPQGAKNGDILQEDDVYSTSEFTQLVITQLVAFLLWVFSAHYSTCSKSQCWCIFTMIWPTFYVKPEKHKPVLQSAVHSGEAEQQCAKIVGAWGGEATAAAMRDHTVSHASFLCQRYNSSAWQRCLRDAQRTWRRPSRFQAWGLTEREQKERPG